MFSLPTTGRYNPRAKMIGSWVTSESEFVQAAQVSCKARLVRIGREDYSIAFQPANNRRDWGEERDHFVTCSDNKSRYLSSRDQWEEVSTGASCGENLKSIEVCMLKNVRQDGIWRLSAF
jgi:hypothetical protein